MKQRRNTNISHILSLQKGFSTCVPGIFHFISQLENKPWFTWPLWGGYVHFPALLGNTGEVISAQELMALLSHPLFACLLRQAFPKLHQPMVYTRQHHPLLSLWASVLTLECAVPVSSTGAGSTSHGLVWPAGSAGVARGVGCHGQGVTFWCRNCWW